MGEKQALQFIITDELLVTLPNELSLNTYKKTGQPVFLYAYELKKYP